MNKWSSSIISGENSYDNLWFHLVLASLVDKMTWIMFIYILLDTSIFYILISKSYFTLTDKKDMLPNSFLSTLFTLSDCVSPINIFIFLLNYLSLSSLICLLDVVAAIVVVAVFLSLLSSSSSRYNQSKIYQTLSSFLPHSWRFFNLTLVNFVIFVITFQIYISLYNTMYISDIFSFLPHRLCLLEIYNL